MQPAKQEQWNELPTGFTKPDEEEGNMLNSTLVDCTQRSSGFNVHY